MISDTLFFSTFTTIIGYHNTKDVWQKKITCVRILHITGMAFVFKPCSIQSVPYNNNTLEYIGEKSKQ